jgi:hypothetical protein
LPGIDSGRMSITPGKLQGVASDLINALKGEARAGGIAHLMGVGQTTHVGVATFAFDARADGAQSLEGVAALVTVVPGDGQGALGAVGRNAGRSCLFVHNAKPIVEDVFGQVNPTGFDLSNNGRAALAPVPRPVAARGDVSSGPEHQGCAIGPGSYLNQIRAALRRLD